jgi:hypothetical protein
MVEVTHGNVSKHSQQNVDEEVGVASALKEDTDRWEDDGEEDLADVAVGVLASASAWLWEATNLAVNGMVAVLMCVYLLEYGVRRVSDVCLPGQKDNGQPKLVFKLRRDDVARP